MLKKYRKPALVVLGICIFSFIDWDLSAYSSLSEISRQTENSESQKECCGLFNGPLVSGLNTGLIQTIAWVDRNHDFVGAASSVAIALLMLTLWWATRGLLRTSGRQLKVAETALIDLERPYVFVDLGDTVLRSGYVRAQGGKVHVDFTQSVYTIYFKFVNYGKTPAILTALRRDIRATESGDLPAVIDPLTDHGEPLPQGMAFGGGNHHEFTVNLRASLYHAHPTSTFLLGFVRYQDIFARKYITGFCSRYDVDSNRFILEGDERYNYTKEE